MSRELKNQSPMSLHNQSLHLTDVWALREIRTPKAMKAVEEYKQPQ